MRRLALLMFLGGLSACATTGDALRPGEVRELRSSVSRGEPVASRRLAGLVAEGRLPGGTISEAVSALEPHATGFQERALLAELEAARAEPARSFAHWLKLLDAGEGPPWIRGHAALRALHLIDSVPLTQEHGEAADRILRSRVDPSGPLLAQLALEIGVRLGQDRLMERARRRLGPILRYRTSIGRVSSTPAMDLVPLESDTGEAMGGIRMSPWTETPDGRVSLPDDGPGLYVLQVPIPERAGGWTVELLTAAATAVQLPNGEWVTNHRLRQHRPRRQQLVMPPGPATQLTVRVAVRTGGAQVQMWARPILPPVEPPSRDDLMGRLAHLWGALWRESAHDAWWAAESLQRYGRGVAALALVHRLRLDETVPGDVGRPLVHQLLEQGRATSPDFDAATLELAELHVAEGDIRQAEALRGTLGSTSAIQRLDLLLAQEYESPERLERAVDALRQALPTSCGALLEWLVVHGERLRADPSAMAAIGPEPGCVEVQLALVELEMDAWELKAAERRLAKLETRLAPGFERDRALALRRRIDVGQETSSSSEGVLAGEQLSPELTWWLSGIQRASLPADLRRHLVHSRGLDDEARRLLLDPVSDLGLPLSEPRSILRRPPGQGHSAQLLLNDIHTTVMADGAVVRRHHRLIHIGDEEAVETWGEQGLPDGAEILLARTWESTDTGAWLPVSAEDLPDTGAISLPRVAVGVVLEVAWWSWESSPLEAQQWSSRFLSREALGSAHGTTRLARYRVNLPPGWRLAWETTGPLEAPERPAAEQWVWTARDLERHQPEARDPRPDRRVASVRAVASPPGEAEPRDALQGGELEEVLWATRPSPEVAVLAAELLKGAEDTPRGRLRALYEGLLRTVEQGASVTVSQAHAAFVAARRQGNRAALFLSMCEITDLPCELVLVRPRSRGVDHSARLPVDPDDWIYPLVLVSLAEGDVWLDFSTPYARFDHMPPFVQDAPGLRIRPEKGWVRTPLRDNGTRQISVEITVDPDGDVHVRGVETMVGYVASGWRRLLVSASEERRERALRGLVQQMLPGFEVDAVTMKNLEKINEPLGFDWSARGRSRRREAVRSFSLNLSPERLAAVTLQQPKRLTPMWFERFTDIAVQITARLPSGWEPRHVPTVIRAGLPGAEYQRDAWWDEEEETLSIRKRFQLTPLVVLPGEYDRWARVARAVDEADALFLEFGPRPEP